MTIFWISLGFGLVTASVLAMASVGMSLQFGVTNYINFAYGDFLTLGAYLALVANTTFNLNIWLCVLIGGLGVAVFGILANRFIMQPFIRRESPRLFLLVVTFGLSLVMANAIVSVFGAGFHRYRMEQPGPFHVGAMIFTPSQFAIIGIAILAMVGVHLLLTRTTLGKSMRAMSDNPDLARSTGINVDQVAMRAWFISSALAGIAGVILAIDLDTFQPTFGTDFLFVIFAAVVLGGIGQVYGAMLGALLIGVVTEMSVLIIPAVYKGDTAFVVLILVLVLRPEGLIRARGKTA